MTDSNKKNNKELDLGLSEILNRQNNQNKTASLKKINEDPVEIEVKAESVFISEKDFLLFTELSKGNKWSELLVQSEKLLTSSKDKYPFLKIWWIYAAIKSSSMPISLLVPTIDKTVKDLSGKLTDKIKDEPTVIKARQALSIAIEECIKSEDCDSLELLESHLESLGVEKQSIALEDRETEDNFEYEIEDSAVVYQEKKPKGKFKTIFFSTLFSSIVTAFILYNSFGGTNNLESNKELSLKKDFTTNLVYSSKKRKNSDADKIADEIVSKKEPKELAKILDSLSSSDLVSSEMKVNAVKSKPKEGYVAVSLNLNEPKEPKKLRKLIDDYYLEKKPDVQSAEFVEDIPLKPVIMAKSDSSRVESIKQPRGRRRVVEARNIDAGRRYKISKASLVYTHPGRNADVLTELEVGSEVEVTENLGRWLKISSSHDSVGYIFSDVVEDISN